MNEQTTYSLHEDFIRRIQIQFGEQAGSFLKSLEQKSSTSIRINPGKFMLPDKEYKKIPWCSNGIFLNKRPIFTLDPLLHAGAYYVQESSSMFLEQAFKAINKNEPKLILDLCGAPGGKSTHLLSLMGNDDLLVTNEVIQSRAKILQENVRKWGAGNVIISNSDPKDFQHFNGLFDLIVVDAPCSGEGLFRKDHAARGEWSPENAQLCSVRQRRILADIWPSLKQGGHLIYSTCTFNPEENEKNLEWLQTQKNFECVKITLQAEWGVEEVSVNKIHAYRFLPHRVKGEGFFICILRKTDNEQAFRFQKKQKINTQKVPASFSFVKNWLIPGNLNMQIQKDRIIAFPERWIKELNALYSSIKILSFGLPVAEIKGKNVTPSHEMAISLFLNKNSFEHVDLDLEEALKFLRKEEIKTGSSKTGWQIVRFREIPLGFIKNLGTRGNNYYPKEWRIRMQDKQERNLWYD